MEFHMLSFIAYLQKNPFHKHERKYLHTSNSAFVSPEYADEPIPQTGRNMRPISLSMIESVQPSRFLYFSNMSLFLLSFALP